MSSRLLLSGVHWPCLAILPSRHIQCCCRALWAVPVYPVYWRKLLWPTQCHNHSRWGNYDQSNASAKAINLNLRNSVWFLFFCKWISISSCHNYFLSFSGPCDAGYYCTLGSDTAMPDTGHTGTAGPCPEGHYCTQATVTPTPCPLGTYNNETKVRLQFRQASRQVSGRLESVRVSIRQTGYQASKILVQFYKQFSTARTSACLLQIFSYMLFY